MKKTLFLCILFFACENEQKKIEKSSSTIHIFKHSEPNSYLENYIKSYGTKGEETIFTISFDSDSTFILSESLNIEQPNLIGHHYFNDDIILIYDSVSINEKFIQIKNIQHDSIKNFPYQINNPPPFDPTEKRYDLKKFTEVIGFKGSNLPLRIR